MKNWAGNVEFQPRTIAKPNSETELAAIIVQAAQQRRKVRCVGSGHSFTRLIETEDVLVSLDDMQGVVSHTNETATVRAGTKLKRLGSELDALGFGLENLGDIDVQALAGALATGTHGTGRQLGVISTQVEALKLINGQGEIVMCSRTENVELFRAAQVSLGSLGVIVEAKLRTQPRYKLAMEQTRGDLDEALAQVETYNESHRHFEFFWFPHTKTVLQKLTKVSNEDPLPVTMSQHLTDVVLENIAFEGISKVARLVPAWAPKISRLCASLASGNRRRDWSHRVFATPRWVKFVEMEYGVPIDSFHDVIRDIERELAKSNHRVHFPIECRFVKGDDIWLSPAQGGDRAFISVHMYRGMPYKDYFAAMEAIFAKYGGRPHWGKLHTLRGPQLSALYPHWADFQRMRKQMDPQGVFETTYMNGIWNG
jgi:FAD-linked oxidoreductase